MKLTAILMVIFCLHLTARTVGQRITLSLKNAHLESVFNEIQKQSGYNFVYNNRLVKHTRSIDLDVKDATVEEVLRQCFQDQPLTYTIEDRTIVVKPAVAVPDAPTMLPPGEIHGKVADSNGRPMQGVSVSNRKLKKGTTTDAEGNFTIPGSENDLLVFSFVGYKSFEQKAPALSHPLSIVLQVDVSPLTETIVVAYGTTTRKDLTGSVSTVAAKDIQDIPFATVDNALAGKAAGVEVTKTDGSPGGAVRIRVRGTSSLLGGNDPLYVIDGVPVAVQSSYVSPGYDVTNPIGNDISAGTEGSSSGLSTAFVNGLNSLGGLNIDDIESITILKDASSTAIYGSKASNGVVIITTKRGKKDMQPRVTFNYYGTLTTLTRKPKILNATQYKELLTEAAQNDNTAHDLAGYPHYPITDQIVNDPSAFFGTANTDWLDLVTRKTFSNNAEIAIQGGGAASRYYTSIGFNNTPGIVIGTSYQRVTGELKLENDIGKHLKILTHLSLGYTNQNIGNGAYDQALKARPDYTPYDSSGNFTNFASVGESYQGFQNPLALTSGIDNSKTTSLLGSLSAVYDFNENLHFKSTVSLNDQAYNQRLYTPSYVMIGSYYGSVSSGGGIGNNANRRFADWLVENTLSYKKYWNERHMVDIVAGTSYETQKSSYFSATATGYPNDNILNSLSSAVTPLYVQGDDPAKPQSYLLSFYLRANYSYLDRYLLTFTGRSDGSSKFGPDNKFGYFPSGAVAWRVSKERFLKDVSWIGDIKLRGSYGLTGNQNIGDQMYRTLYSPLSYGGTNALAPTQLGNPDIKWETTSQTDVGVDISLFKDRLQATFDYYKKQTNDALLALPETPSSAFPSLLSNIVGIRNKGVELSLSGDIIRSKNFRWNASFNISRNRSIVTKISSAASLAQIGSKTGLEAGNTAIIQGQPLGLMTGMKVTGIIRTQKQLDDYKSQLGPYAQYSFPYLGIGDPMFLLDTVTNPTFPYPYFNTIIGSGAPKYYGGFTQGFSYKNFELDFNFTFSQGGKLLWGDDVSSLTFSGTSNANAVMLKRYTPTNPNASRPRLLFSDQVLNTSSLSLFNSSYVKLRTLSLNYRLNKSIWMKNAGLQSAVVYASANNVFIITKYPGSDPETSDDSYSVQGGYFDVSNYPSARTFSLGLKVGF